MQILFLLHSWSNFMDSSIALFVPTLSSWEAIGQGLVIAFYVISVLCLLIQAGKSVPTAAGT